MFGRFIPFQVSKLGRAASRHCPHTCNCFKSVEILLCSKLNPISCSIRFYVSMLEINRLYQPADIAVIPQIFIRENVLFISWTQKGISVSYWPNRCLKYQYCLRIFCKGTSSVDTLSQYQELITINMQYDINIQTLFPTFNSSKAFSVFTGDNAFV